MTEEVAAHVLLDNYEQVQMLSLEASVVVETADLFRRYMRELEKNGRLNRELEFLPDEKLLLERQANGKCLTRPEIAILMAYCKMFLKQDILVSDVPEDPYFVRYLTQAFPAPLREQYLPQMLAHRLKREIIATQLSKTVTDHMGINFVERLQRETGADVAFVMRAYVITIKIYDMENIWQQIEKLDWLVSPEVQQKMMLQLYNLIRRATRWFLRTRKPDLVILDTIHDFAQPIADLIQDLPSLLVGDDQQYFVTEMKNYILAGVPELLARRIAFCNTLFTSLDIVEAARKNDLLITEVAQVYYLLGAKLELNWLRDQMDAYSMENQWDELARSGYRDDLDRVQRKLSVSVLRLKQRKYKDKTIDERIAAWLIQYHRLITRWQNLVTEIKSSTNVGFVTYSVVLRELFDFAQVG
jgi:glutamate dehydrogenase